MPLLLGPLPWLVLRAVVGFGCAGLFITTESWLNAKAEPAERGRIFSIYMAGTFLALALGQLLIGPAEIETAAPFNAIVALFAVALVMASTTRAEPPRLTVGAALPYSAHDRMPTDRVVAVSGQLILVSWLGSVIGPLIGTSLMARFSIDGVFYFMAAAALLLTFLAAGRSLTTASPQHRERPFEILAPQAAALAHDQLGSSDEPPVAGPHRGRFREGLISQ